MLEAEKTAGADRAAGGRGVLREYHVEVFVLGAKAIAGDGEEAGHILVGAEGKGESHGGLDTGALGWRGFDQLKIQLR